MGVLGDIAISPGDIMRRLRDLERQVRELLAGRRLEAASIGRGGVTVKDGGAIRVRDTDGSLLVWMGNLGNDLRGSVLYRAGGSAALGVFGTGTGGDVGFIGMYDRSGNPIVTDDVLSGRGLARPFIPLQVNEVSVPTATTTSGTFTDVAVGMVSVQHPVMYAYLLVRASDVTTAGEVRLALQGVGIGPTVTVDAGAYVYTSVGPFALTDPPPYGVIRGLSVQARRTAGAGTIGVRVMSIMGLESAFV
ncbi:hypothetical protein [Micromonospora carbonacea]|uniref:hypothetical protein n=1 Tax=Micromonospora carbonacea TaxID=47853 RepID=UPI0037185DE0